MYNNYVYNQLYNHADIVEVVVTTNHDIVRDEPG
jgi:hypothetical protein